MTHELMTQLVTNILLQLATALGAGYIAFKRGSTSWWLITMAFLGMTARRCSALIKQFSDLERIEVLDSAVLPGFITLLLVVGISIEVLKVMSEKRKK